MPDNYPLPSADPVSLGFAPTPLQHLDRLIRQHIEEGRYPGAQIALATRTAEVGAVPQLRRRQDRAPEGAGDGRDAVPPVQPDQGVDQLRRCGRWSRRASCPSWTASPTTCRSSPSAARARSPCTRSMTHQGGFPSGRRDEGDLDRPRADARRGLRLLASTGPRARRLQYHPRAAHLTQAMVIEAVTGQDYRDVIRDKVLAPLGLANDIFVGVPASEQERCADTYAPEPRDNSAEFKAAGMPSGGGYATARGMAAFYQMLLGRGRLGDVRLLSPRLIAYVTRSHTGERGDDAMGGIPMHRGLGPHVAR